MPKASTAAATRRGSGTAALAYHKKNPGISKDSAESTGCGVGGSGVFTLEYPNNEVYKGEVHNDKREGYGEYYFSNGVV